MEKYLTKTNVITAVGITAATIAATILIRRRTFGKKLSDYIIMKKLEGRQKLHGNIKDYEDVFAGQSYLNSVKSSIEKKYGKAYGYIMLRDEYIEKYRKNLHDAIYRLGTDDSKVKDTFASLRDKVAVAQISESYKKAYKTNLLDDLLSESSFSIGSEGAKYIEGKLNSIPPYRLIKK